MEHQQGLDETGRNGARISSPACGTVSTGTNGAIDFEPNANFSHQTYTLVGFNTHIRHCSSSPVLTRPAATSNGLRAPSSSSSSSSSRAL